MADGLTCVKFKCYAAAKFRGVEIKRKDVIRFTVKGARSQQIECTFVCMSRKPSWLVCVDRDVVHLVRPMYIKTVEVIRKAEA
ncbi:MAG: hypothetical protein C4291_14510 [Candidatus Dadabacteria bacterium]